jgi:hypothetical protein
MRLPSSIKIGSQFWTVSEQKRKHSADPDHYGFTNDKDLSIVIDAEMPDSLKRTTLLHEILHAIRFTFGGSFAGLKGASFTDLEHYFIGLYEEPLMTLLRENPELSDYLLAPYDS